MNHWEKYLQLKQEQPYLRQKDGADALGVGEGALLADAPGVIYLDEPRTILQKIENMGPLQCTVRNDVAVHEKVGVYKNLKVTEQFGIAVNAGGIDVRLFTSRWHAALAYTFFAHERELHSIQFFDEYGLAVQKIYLQDESYLPAWQEMLSTHASEIKPIFKNDFKRQIQSNPKLSEQELSQYHSSWFEMKDVHQFNKLIADYDLSRIAAFEQAPANHAFRLQKESIETILNLVQAQEIPVMIFVGNRGAVQIQTGTIHNVKRLRGWLNILDSKENDFVLHLDDEKIQDVWVVFRYCQDGLVSCLEAFDKNGDIALTLFGQRSEGQAELASWQAALCEIAQCQLPQ